MKYLTVSSILQQQHHLFYGVHGSIYLWCCKQNGGGEVAVGFEEQRHCSWLYEGI